MSRVDRVRARRSGGTVGPILLALLVVAPTFPREADGRECISHFGLGYSRTCRPEPMELDTATSGDASVIEDDDGTEGEGEAAQGGGADEVSDAVTDAEPAKDTAAAAAWKAFFLSLVNVGRGKREEEAVWRRRATVGVGFDDNPASATSAAAIPKWGLPDPLPEEKRKRGAFFAMLRADIEHRQPWGEGRDWLTAFSATGRRTGRTVTDYDAFRADLSTGPRWLLDPRVTFELPLRASIGRFETTDRGFARQWQSWEVAVAPRFRQTVTKGVDVVVDGAVGRRTHYAEPDQTTPFAEVATGFEIRTAGFGTVSLAATLGREPARSPIEADTNRGAVFSWHHRPIPNLGLSARCALTTYRFDATDPIYGAERRRDDRVTIGAEAVWTVEALGADLVLSHAHTRNRSNQPLHAFERDVTTVAVRKPF